MPRTVYALCIFLLTACTTHAQSPDSLTLGFERIRTGTALPEGWGQGIGKGSSGKLATATVRLDSAVKHGGRYSLALTLPAGEDFVSAVHSIPTTYDGRIIMLSGWVKMQDVAQHAGLWMRIDGKDGSVLEFDNMMKTPVTGTRDWQRFEVYLEYNREKAATINVGALLVGGGKMWVDDLRIELDERDIASVPEYRRASFPADLDTAYRQGSGVATVSTATSEEVRRLAAMGQVWAFIKYYHPAVRAGRHNIDAALLRGLPAVLAAKTSADADAAIERWADGFGKPAPCPSCTRLEDIPKDSIALRPDYGDLFREDFLPASLRTKLAYIRDNRGSADSPNYYIGMAPGVGNPVFQNEPTYANNPFPDAGLRLLALYRFWGMIQYFFPDRHLMKENWPAVLRENIPAFCNAGDTAAYQLAALKLIERVHDGHAGLWRGSWLVDKEKGKLMTPFAAAFAGDELVVTGYYKDTLGVRNAVQTGDVIEAIDGVPVAELVEKYSPLTTASNPVGQRRDLPSYRGWLLRSDNPTARLRIRRDGKAQDVVVNRIPTSRDMWAQEQGRERSDVGYKKLPGNIGYLYPAKLSDADLDGVKATLHKTKGLVIDLRCYPTTFMPFTYGAWLKPDSTAFVRFTVGSTDWPGLFRHGVVLGNGEKNKDAYRGKVVILVDASTQSQAEYTAMAFQTIPGAVTVGSQTAGADGNVSQIDLPGGVGTMISGIGILYPDGTETQREGVRIDKVVKPTAAGIRAGKDEVLEAALQEIGQ